MQVEPPPKRYAKQKARSGWPLEPEAPRGQRFPASGHPSWHGPTTNFAPFLLWSTEWGSVTPCLPRFGFCERLKHLILSNNHPKEVCVAQSTTPVPFGRQHYSTQNWGGRRESLNPRVAPLDDNDITASPF